MGNWALELNKHTETYQRPQAFCSALWLHHTRNGTSTLQLPGRDKNESFRRKKEEKLNENGDRMYSCISPIEQGHLHLAWILDDSLKDSIRLILLQQSGTVKREAYSLNRREESKG